MVCCHARARANVARKVADSDNANDQKPEGLEDEHLLFLDDLRESGITNMYGASPYLARAFDLDSDTARAYLAYWMRTFSERHPKD